MKKGILFLVLFATFAWKIPVHAQQVKDIKLTSEPIILLPKTPVTDELLPKRIPWFFIGCGIRTRVAIPTYAIQEVRVILGGFPAEFGYREIAFKPDETPQHVLMPLTHRTYKRSIKWSANYFNPLEQPFFYPTFF